MRDLKQIIPKNELERKYKIKFNNIKLKLKPRAITKKNIAYKYLNDCVIFSLKISGK